MNNINEGQWPYYSKREMDAVTSILSSGRVNYWTGDEGEHFESEYADYFGVAFAVAVSNGTVALELALRALGIGTGDEVIVTSRTFFASVSCIAAVGAVPVFADVDRDSQVITANTINDVVTEKTRAVICVHLAGWVCDMPEIQASLDGRGIFLIEDCAQSHGAKYQDKYAGTFGDVACWSFCQDKIMSTGGEGGMVTTDNKDIYEKIWSMKDHGKGISSMVKTKPGSSFRWLHESFGTNARMTEIQAAIGRIQLEYLSDWIEIRRKKANYIWDVGSSCLGLRVPMVPNSIEHAAYKCYVFVEPSMLKEGWTRDRIIEEMRAEKTSAFSGSCPEVYLEEAVKKAGFGPDYPYPICKELGETSIMFTVHPTLPESSTEKLCEVLIKTMKKAIR